MFFFFFLIFPKETVSFNIRLSVYCFICHFYLVLFKSPRSLLGGAVVKNPLPMQEMARDLGSVLGLERSSEGGNDNPLQYSCLENPIDRGAWWATVCGGVMESDMTEHSSLL